MSYSGSIFLNFVNKSNDLFFWFVDALVKLDLLVYVVNHPFEHDFLFFFSGDWSFNYFDKLQQLSGLHLALNELFLDVADDLFLLTDRSFDELGLDVEELQAVPDEGDVVLAHFEQLFLPVVFPAFLRETLAVPVELVVADPLEELLGLTTFDGAKSLFSNDFIGAFLSPRHHGLIIRLKVDCHFLEDVRT